MRSRGLAASLLVAGLAALSGCGGGGYVSVSGLVTLDGEPLPEATVSFVPDGGGEIATGVTDEDGRFSLTSNRDTGAKPGVYKVTIVATDEKAEPSLGVGQIMAAKYGKAGEAQKVSGGDAQKVIKEQQKTSAERAKRARRKTPPIYGDLIKTPLTATVPQPEYKFDLKKDAK